MTTRPRIWVGIDVGKASHHGCAVDETGKVVWTQKLVNEQRGSYMASIVAHQVNNLLPGIAMMLALVGIMPAT